MPARVGRRAADHALLGAVIAQPDTGGLTLTGRISLDSQRWLADHRVSDAVLFPGTGFVELALRAGREAGCEVVEELTLQQPLELTVGANVHIQVTVGAAEDGRRRGRGLLPSRGPGGRLAAARPGLPVRRRAGGV